MTELAMITMFSQIQGRRYNAAEAGVDVVDVMVVTDRIVTSRIREVFDRFEIGYEGGWAESDTRIRWTHAVGYTDGDEVRALTKALAEVWEPSWDGVDSELTVRVIRP